MEIAAVLLSQGALAGAFSPPGKKDPVVDSTAGVSWTDLTAALAWARSPRALSTHLSHLEEDRLIFKIPLIHERERPGHPRYLLSPRSPGSTSKGKRGSWEFEDEAMARDIPQTLPLAVDALRFDRCARCGGRGVLRFKYGNTLTEAACLECKGTGELPQNREKQAERLAGLVRELCLGYDRFIIDAARSMYCRRCGGRGGFGAAARR